LISCVEEEEEEEEGDASPNNTIGVWVNFQDDDDTRNSQLTCLNATKEVRSIRSVILLIGSKKNLASLPIIWWGESTIPFLSHNLLL
jgi:hypothetical protein